MEHESVSGELEIDLYQDLTAFSSKSPEQQEAEVERIVVRPSGPLIKEPEPDTFDSGFDSKRTEVPLSVQPGELPPHNSFDTSEDLFDQTLLSGRDEISSGPSASAEPDLFDEPLFQTEHNPATMRSTASNGEEHYPEPLFDTGDLIDPSDHSTAGRTTTGLNHDNVSDGPVQPVIAYNRTSDLQSPAAQPAAPTAGPGEVVCGSCGELTAADDLLCIACGSFLGDIGSDAPLAAAAEPEPEPEVQTGPQILTCSDCGSEVTPDELFCPSCGAVL